MESRGVNQSSLAKKSGVSQSNISLYLSGGGAPGIDALAALAIVLETTADSLLGLKAVTPMPEPREPTPEEIAEFLTTAVNAFRKAVDSGA